MKWLHYFFPALCSSSVSLSPFWVHYQSVLLASYTYSHSSLSWPVLFQLYFYGLHLLVHVWGGADKVGWSSEVCTEPNRIAVIATAKSQAQFFFIFFSVYFRLPPQPLFFLRSALSLSPFDVFMCIPLGYSVMDLVLPCSISPTGPSLQLRALLYGPASPVWCAGELAHP